MDKKEYKLFKTVKKTAKENNLIIADNASHKNLKLLLEFSLLDEIDISEEEKETVRKKALKDVTPAFLSLYYMTEFDDFSYCNGKALFYKHRVYTDNGCKYLYDILQLGKIIHSHYERKSRYDDYQETIKSADCGYSEPISDLEI